MKKVYKITGLSCPSCASLLEIDLEEKGIKCKCSYHKQTLEILGSHDPKMLKEVLFKLGYNILV